MTILDLLGYFTLIFVALYMTSASAFTIWCALVGLCGKRAPFIFSVLAVGMWFACWKLFPFTVAWKV